MKAKTELETLIDDINEVCRKNDAEPNIAIQAFGCMFLAIYETTWKHVPDKKKEIIENGLSVLEAWKERLKLRGCQKKEKRKQEYLKRMLAEVGNDDIENSHINADNILCEILKEVGGFDEILKAYEKVEKWFA